MSCQVFERQSVYATRPRVSSLRRRLLTGIGVAAAVVGMLVGAGGRPRALGLWPSFSVDSQPTPMTETWTFDRLDQIGGHPTTVLGSPRVIDSPLGKAVEFDAVGEWYHVAAVYDGTTYSNYVNGVQQLAFPIALAPQDKGRASVGVRVTLVDYFKGAVHSARFARRALMPAEFTGIGAERR